jgi:hypothetical protein
MPWYYRFREFSRQLTPKQLQAMMDNKAKKESEKYRSMR